MTEVRNMILGGRTFAVPPLPLGVTMDVYPLCRKLSLSGGLVDRVTSSTLVEAIEDEDMRDLANLLFPVAKTADPDLTREQFDALPISPPELFDAFFFVARFQTGMWMPAATDAGEAAGEAAGEPSPQTSTSEESSAA